MIVWWVHSLFVVPYAILLLTQRCHCKQTYAWLIVKSHEKEWVIWLGTVYFLSILVIQSQVPDPIFHRTVILTTVIMVQIARITAHRTEIVRAEL